MAQRVPAREAAPGRGIVTAMPRVAVVAWGVTPVTAYPSAPAVTPCHHLPDVDHTAAKVTPMTLAAGTLPFLGPNRSRDTRP